MKTGKTLNELAAEITRQAEAKKDFIAPVSKLQVQPGGLRPEDGIELAIGKKDATTDYFGINSVGHQQIAEYTGIPQPYYKRLLEKDPELLSKNINRWLPSTATDRRLVRTLDGQVRAFLSDKYRPLDNEQLAEAILPVLLDRNLLVLSAQITETRLYIKAVDKQILKDIPTGAKLGEGHTRFDTISPGITIANSEVGFGALSINSSVYTGGCTNLMIAESLIRKTHVGGRAQTTDEVYALLTDRTKALTDKAVFSQVRDVVAAAFDEARFAAQAKKLTAAAGVKIESTDVVEVVERFGKKFQLAEGTRKGILQRLIEGGDLTKYGLHAAVTRHSADVENYDEATDLERLGSQVIDLSPSEWKAVAVAA